MTQSSTSSAGSQSGSPLAHAVRVCAPLAAACLLAVGPAYWISGPIGLAAVGVAAAVCVLASVGADSVAALLGNGQPLAGVLAGMFIRMAVPLVFVMIVYRQPGPLVEAGLVFYLLGFYMVTLVADTRHAMARVAANGQMWEVNRGR